MKKLHLLFTLVFAAPSIFGQIGITPADDAPIKLDCPQFPMYDNWDRNCLIKTAEPYGEIRLPQAGVDGLNLQSPMWLTMPINKPGWALGIAHAWNLHRNYIRKINYPKISYYSGILGIETGLACTCTAKFDSLTWPWTSLRRDDWDTKCKFSNPHEGCFQMEEWNAWGQLNMIFPDRFRCEGFNENIPGHRFETQAIALTYRNIYNHMTLEYSWNTRLWEIIENPACDPYAYEKLLAVGWNSWIGGIYQNIAGLYDPKVNFYTGRATTATHNCWDLAGQMGFYPDVLGWNMSVLDGNTSYCQYQYPVLSEQNNKPAGTQNHKKLPDFDGLYQWSDVSAYIDTVCNFYYEFSLAVDPVKNAAVKKRVKGVFDQLGGGGTVNFKRMGPVVDEIILAFPKEVPLMGSLHDDATPNGYRGNWFSRCPGNYAPASHIENRNLKKDSICIGQTLVAAAVIDGGEGPNLKYKWTVNGVLQANANDSLFNFSAKTVGDYIIQVNVCDPLAGGCADANCFMRIHVSNCKVCNLTATSSTTNTPCQNSPKGTLKLAVTGAANYTVKYEGPYNGTISGTGATAEIKGLVNGIYNITITDKSDATCKYILSDEVKYDVAMENKLTASILELQDCKAKLKAEIEQNNCHCDYTVNMEEISPYRWERYVFFNITPSSGKYETFRGNVFQNTNTVVSKKFSLCTGEKLKVEGHILTASGSCDPRRSDAVNHQRSKYQVWLVGPDGKEIRRDTVKVDVIKQFSDYLVWEFTANCPFKPDPYTYLWTPGNLSGTPVTMSENKYKDVTYTVLATNTLHPSCTLTDTVTVPYKCHVNCVKPDSSAFTPSALSLCKDSTFSFKGNRIKGYEYRWYKDGILKKSGLEEYDFPNLGKGNYQLVIADTISPNDSLCMAISDTVKYKVNALPSILVSGNKTICEGDSVSLTFKLSGSAPFAVAITRGTNTNTFNSAIDSISGVKFKTTGNYQIKVSDASTCASNSNFSILANPIEQVHLPSDTLLCKGQTYKIGAAKNYAFYKWSNGLSGVTADSLLWDGSPQIAVQTTDIHGCKSSDTINISAVQAIKPDLGNDSALCGTTLTLSVANIFKNYKWHPDPSNTNNNTLNIKTAGSFSVTTIDQNNCSASDTIQIALHAASEINGLLKDKTICEGLDLNFNELQQFNDGNDPYTFTWQDLSNNDAFTLPRVSATDPFITNGGKVFVAMKNKFGCVAYDSAAASINTSLSLNIKNSDADKSLCQGETLTLSEPNFKISDGYTFSWQNGAVTSENYEVSTAGKYTLLIEKNGCKGNAEIDIAVNALPTIVLPDNLNICKGDSISINASVENNVALLWNTGNTSTSIFAKNEGKYSVLATNSITQCSQRDSTNISINPLPNFHFTNDTLVACNGDAIKLEATPILNNSNYLWSNGATSTQNSTTTAGIFWLQVTNPLTQCFHRDTVFADFTTIPEVHLGSDTTICEKGLDLSVANPNKSAYSYLWSTKQSSRSIYVTTEGSYFVKVSLGTCSAADTIVVKVKNTPQSTLKNSDLSEITPCFERERNHILIANDDPSLNYTWFVNDELSIEKSNSIAVFRAGKYQVFISNGICPMVKDDIKIKEFCPTNFYVPNAMIHGRAGENGSFKVYGNVPSDQYSLLVFNRWGELIFESYNPNDVWNGTYNGQQVQQDVYVWKITYMENKSSGHQMMTSKIGHVTVLND